MNKIFKILATFLLIGLIFFIFPPQQFADPLIVPNGTPAPYTTKIIQDWLTAHPGDYIGAGEKAVAYLNTPKADCSTGNCGSISINPTTGGVTVGCTNGAWININPPVPVPPIQPAPTSISPAPVPTSTPTPPVAQPPVFPPIVIPPIHIPPIVFPTATPTSVPACGSPCQTPATCQGAQGGCTACTNGTCQVPAPTATPTTAPVCGAPCDANPDICSNISGCNSCQQNPNGNGKTCQPQATATPTLTPVPTSTPTPTPLPFDTSMCTCDGLNYSPISVGNPVDVTAYGKVLGINKNFAKIPSFTFTFYQSGVTDTQANILQTATVNTTLVPPLADEVRYKADWTLNIPSNIDTTKTYRIQAHPTCSRLSAAAFYQTNRVVLGTSTAKSPSFWDRIVSFFTSLFGGAQQSTTNSTSNLPTSTPVPASTKNKQLQLEPYYPATVTTGLDAKNCTFIKFNF